MPCLCSDLKEYFTSSIWRARSSFHSETTAAMNPAHHCCQTASLKKYSTYKEESGPSLQSLQLVSARLPTMCMSNRGQKEGSSPETQAQVEDATEEEVWLRSQRTLQSYCFLPKDTWERLRLQTTLKCIRGENDWDPSLLVLSSHLSQRRQERGADVVLKAGDNIKTLWVLSLELPLPTCFLPLSPLADELWSPVIKVEKTVSYNTTTDGCLLCYLKTALQLKFFVPR